MYQIRIKLAQTATLAVAVLLSPISCCDVVAVFKMAAVARQNGARQRESAAAINYAVPTKIQKNEFHITIQRFKQLFFLSLLSNISKYIGSAAFIITVSIHQRSEMLHLFSFSVNKGSNCGS